MRIAAITATVHEFSVRLPMLERPAQRRLVFATVETDAGLAGHGLTGAFLPAAVKAAIEQDLAPLLLGADPEATEAIHDRIARTLNPRGFTGTLCHAVSAIDIALWDLKGKIHARPVAALLGGARDTCPTYVTFGFPGYDAEALVRVAERVLAEGATALKMVVGARPGGWREDLARIRRVREAIGPEVALMIDANCAFDPFSARELARAAAGLDLAWFEEPIAANDPRALADLRRLGGIPIATGQMEGDRYRHRALIEAGAIDVLQPNVCYGGGFTEVQKVAHMAQAFNLRLDNGGGWPLCNLHAMAGLANGGAVEFHLDMRAIGETLFEEAPRPANGTVRVPDRPGLGLVPRAEVLAATRIL
jgi:L-alanine-DL-glutamate epimerase-like enolase superfamily enzyme